eukprot:7509487-Alexandrium_andersonii.AAC.1
MDVAHGHAERDGNHTVMVRSHPVTGEAGQAPDDDGQVHLAVRGRILRNWVAPSHAGAGSGGRRRQPARRGAELNQDSARGTQVAWHA